MNKSRKLMILYSKIAKYRNKKQYIVIKTWNQMNKLKEKACENMV